MIEIIAFELVGESGLIAEGSHRDIRPCIEGGDNDYWEIRELVLFRSGPVTLLFTTIVVPKF